MDRRTDVWAFGCLLYEMLAGTRAFEGADAAATVSQILEREPDFAALPAETPLAVRRLIASCLEKNLHKRLAQIAVARFQLEDAHAAIASAAQTRVRSRRRTHTTLALGVSAGLVAGLVIAWLSLSGPASIPAEVTRSVLSVIPAERIGGTEGRPTRTALAISRDGRTLVFSAAQAGARALYLRPLDQAHAVKLPGTDGGEHPFVSPDAQWVGFWAKGELRKVALAGGPAVRVAQTAPLISASWGEDDRIVYSSSDGPLFEVQAAGGTPRPLTVVNSEHGEYQSPASACAPRRRRDSLHDHERTFPALGRNADRRVLAAIRQFEDSRRRRHGRPLRFDGTSSLRQGGCSLRRALRPAEARALRRSCRRGGRRDAGRVISKSRVTILAPPSSAFPRPARSCTSPAGSLPLPRDRWCGSIGQDDPNRYRSSRVRSRHSACRPMHSVSP